MTAPATAFLTYLWHYMAARFLYDEVVRRHVAAGAASSRPSRSVGFALWRGRRT